jgi:diguanylate cyclase (GGDEF)-like protein
VTRSASELETSAPSRPAARTRALPAWICYLVLGAASTSVFLVSDRPWVQASFQVPIYGISAALLVWRWWRSPSATRDPLFTLAVAAFGLYFSASIVAALLPLLASPPAMVAMPSSLDVAFLTSYILLGLFLWLLGSRSGGSGRRDILDTLIVVGGMAPVFWLLLVAPIFETRVPLSALLTFVAYPLCVFGLFCLTVRLAFVARRPTILHLLLGVWIAGELTGDVVFLSVSLADEYVYGQPWQALWIVSATCIGGIALHPRAAVLLESHTRATVNGSRRLWVLAGCLATPIATIFFRESSTTDYDGGVLVATVAAFFLVFLLCLRLSGLMVDNATQLRVQVELQRLSDDLVHQSKHDPLTGLGNRLLFAQTADQVLAEATSDGARGVAVLLLDLDDFKLVNDTFGHDAGDQVLVEVARRLEDVIRDGDNTVFRLGGDEFVVLSPRGGLQEALVVADRITAALSAPLELGSRQVRPVGCIGISVAIDHRGRGALLAEADVAMYAAKARGTSPLVFDPVLHRETLDREQLSNDLRAAVARRELRVVYQPLVHLASEGMVGVEALLRWDHPTRGTISPVQFIPLAEENGAILEIGDWVMEESLRQLRLWDLSNSEHRLRMSVNVSPRQLNDSEFVTRFAAMLGRSGLEPGRLTLEITEAAFGADAEDIIERLHQLKRLGVMLAMDDFGTEYSSLSKLRRLPVDVLKIDKAFVDGIAREPRERALTAAIVSLAASLGKATVAEGIETIGQYAQLLDLGVELGQGYLFSEPVDPEDIEHMVARAVGRAFQRL